MMPSATITMDGHILDSLLLPKVLDLIVSAGAEYEIEVITVGKTRHDPSHARIRLDASEQTTLDVLLTQAVQHGASRAD